MGDWEYLVLTTRNCFRLWEHVDAHLKGGEPGKAKRLLAILDMQLRESLRIARRMGL
jgi:hypothetical protein